MTFSETSGFTLLIQPLQLLFEVVYVTANRDHRRPRPVHHRAEPCHELSGAAALHAGRRACRRRSATMEAAPAHAA